MIERDKATPYMRAVWPYVFDRIEVAGRVFTGPPPGDYFRAVFERPSEPVRFCLLGTFHCEYPSGPHLALLANRAAELVGDGFYGLGSARRAAPGGLVMERPNYEAGVEVDGPYPPPVVVPWWALPLVFFLVCLIAGALACQFGAC